MDLVFLKIRAIFSDFLDIDQHKILSESNLVDDLGLDSLDLVELIFFCEDEFKVEFADNAAVAEFKTIKDICLYVRQNFAIEISQLELTEERSNQSNPKEYDENTILTSYIWRYYIPLMTSFERKVGGQLLRLQKAEAGAKGDLMRLEKLKNRYGWVNDPLVIRALEVGYEEYRDQVRIRLLREHSNDIFINRCPECKRIVQTPQARQCLWCGYSWHLSN